MSEGIIMLHQQREIQQTQDEFVNKITDKPLPSIERLVCFLKNFGESSDPVDIKQCISAAANIELFAQQVRKELDDRRKDLIVELGGRVD